MAPPPTIGDNVARLKKAFLHLGTAGMSGSEQWRRCAGRAWHGAETLETEGEIIKQAKTPPKTGSASILTNRLVLIALICWAALGWPKKQAISISANLPFLSS